MIPLEVPEELKDLTNMEEFYISKISPHFKIWSVKCKTNKFQGQTGTKFKGSMISFQKDLVDVWNVLPHIPDENEIYLILNKDVKINLDSLKIRKKKVLDALNYLKNNNI